MGYDAWVTFNHAPITKKQWEKIQEKFYPQFEYNEKTGTIDTSERVHNPDFDEVTEMAKTLARITGMPVSIYWNDDEGDFERIVTPDGTEYDEKRLFETDEGTVEDFYEYLDRKMTTQVMETVKNWSKEDIDEFNRTTFTVSNCGRDEKIAVVIDKEQSKVFFKKPNGEDLSLCGQARITIWKLVLDELRK